MGQGFPGWEPGDLVSPHGFEFGGEVFGFAAGGGDHQEGGVVGQGADGPGLGLVDGGDAQGGVTNVADESFEFGVGGGGFQQSGKHGWGGGCGWGGRLGAHG